jgi:hypothetical protein
MNDLQHPNLVRTLKTTTSLRDPLYAQSKLFSDGVPAGSGGADGGTDSGGGSLAAGSGGARGPGLPGELGTGGQQRLLEETWLLLEYCDMGSLMVRCTF